MICDIIMDLKSIVTLAVFLEGILAKIDWSYDREATLGPARWKNKYQACGDEYQSPVDIDSEHVWYDKNLISFDLNGYDFIPRGAHWELWNIGFAVQIVMDGDYRISEGGLMGEYKAVSLVFHWGSTDSRGSEHTIDGVSYPLEMQIVHYNTQYGSYDEAFQHRDGIAILSFFVKLSKADNPSFRQIIKMLANITHKDEHIPLRPIPLLSLLPVNLNNYYRYYGSLTSPPCTESVIWTVFSDLGEMSQNQLKHFRALIQSPTALLDQNEEAMTMMVNNFRPVQPLYDRTVYSSNNDDASFMTTSLTSSLSIAMATSLGLLLIFLLITRGTSQGEEHIE